MNPDLRALIESGPLAHLSTLNRDGSPQVSVIWIGLDDTDTLVSAHMQRTQKIRNIERDPRVVLSFEAPHEPGVMMAPYAVLQARAEVVADAPAADLLHRLGRLYVAPDFVFPVPEGTPGFLLRYTIDKVGGIGPWAG